MCNAVGFLSNAWVVFVSFFHPVSVTVRVDREIRFQNGCSKVLLLP